MCKLVTGFLLLFFLLIRGEMAFLGRQCIYSKPKVSWTSEIHLAQLGLWDILQNRTQICSVLGGGLLLSCGGRSPETWLLLHNSVPVIYLVGHSGTYRDTCALAGPHKGNEAMVLFCSCFS